MHQLKRKSKNVEWVHRAPINIDYGFLRGNKVGKCLPIRQNFLMYTNRNIILLDENKNCQRS
jgi:hypothetical protein